MEDEIFPKIIIGEENFIKYIHLSICNEICPELFARFVRHFMKKLRVDVLINVLLFGGHFLIVGKRCKHIKYFDHRKYNFTKFSGAGFSKNYHFNGR